ncbi:MAG: hypothetical protein ACHQ0Y_11320 [Thermodesulfovibrionales bacterium]
MSEEQKGEGVKGSRTTRIFPVLIIALVSFVVYANAFFCGFILDDYSQVLKNPIIQDLRNIPEIFLRSAWTFEGAPPTSNYYRPMLNLLYMFTYCLIGPEAWGFHLVKQCRVATMLNPGRPEIHEDLGRALARAGFRDLAVGELEAAVALRPGASLYNLQGVIYAQMGQMEKAVRNFRRASDLEPAREDYRHNLAAAADLDSSLRNKGGQGTDYRWEYDERSLTKEEMFSFVW